MRDFKNQKLGILGGMGPQATQILYQWILDRTDASCDQDNIPTVKQMLFFRKCLKTAALLNPAAAPASPFLVTHLTILSMTFRRKSIYLFFTCHERLYHEFVRLIPLARKKLPSSLQMAH